MHGGQPVRDFHPPPVELREQLRRDNLLRINRWAASASGVCQFIYNPIAF